MKKFIQAIRFCGVFEDSDANAVGIIASILSKENLNFTIDIYNSGTHWSNKCEKYDHSRFYAVDLRLNQKVHVCEPYHNLRNAELLEKGMLVIEQINLSVKHCLISPVTVYFNYPNVMQDWQCDEFLIDGSGDVIAEIEQKIREDI